MILFVCGTFTADGGRPSSIGKAMGISLVPDDMINGGTIKELYGISFEDYEAIVWMPNMDNSEDKILPHIKKWNPHAILISSKRAVEKEYTAWDVVGRLLATRSNLGIMITRDDNGRYNFSLLDPLGNIHYDGTDPVMLGFGIKTRLDLLGEMARCSSQSMGPAKNKLMDEDFMEVVRKTADEFSRHVNANNPNRMLGNASTRCMSGFPAMRGDDSIFVTRRNIDKKTISADGFIETRMRNMYKMVLPTVEYWGDVKPSVDTPIQLMLFDIFKHIKYMIHGHVYIKGAPFTDRKIPCGYLEECDDVYEAIVNNYEPATDNFVINLLGHGCLVMAKDLSYFDEIEYINRPLPEG